MPESAPDPDAGRLFDPTPTLTVGELNQRIGTVLGRAFGDELWIQGEISGLRPDRRSNTHLFFDLIEGGDDGRPAAKLRVALFADNRRGVNALLRGAGNLRMEDGLDVRVRGSVSYFRRNGTIQLKMTAIDPAHTLGRLAASREQVLGRLRTEGLLDRNGQLDLSPFPMRVALVTSADGAARADFLRELEDSGLAWQVRVIDTRVQGHRAEAMICGALATATRARADVVALVRGGGSRTDLAAFDAERIARMIADAPVPVVTGLGHEVDRSVADEVAHTVTKTPTAAAALLVARATDGLARVDRAWATITGAAAERIDAADRSVDRLVRLVQRQTATSLDRSDQNLVACRQRLAVTTRGSLTVARERHRTAAVRLARQAPKAVDRAGHDLDAHRRRVADLDPSRILARGWSITRREDGRVVRSPSEAPAGSTLTTTVAGGPIESTVTSDSDQEAPP